MEEQVWHLVEKALDGAASAADIATLRKLLASDGMLRPQVMEVLASYQDPDPQIPAGDKRRLLAQLVAGNPFCWTAKIW
ncbi:hypothetical protein [Parapedobacter sp. DT-150]|uniref:hypothetical protein n=1 Tax=Parapedobacter sp. DT-150 TaxID=3396162 RepID=UPI003F1CF702